MSLSRLSISLSFIFSLSLVLGTGPGVLLVNRPETLLGVPIVYAWGLFWYVVQVFVILVASFTIWTRSSEGDENESYEEGRVRDTKGAPR